ncbi:MAG: hypothetical protein CMF55_05305 [Legionellales bacterium]|nr:hypothetical protein [Legionellales bacterium]
MKIASSEPPLATTTTNLSMYKKHTNTQVRKKYENTLQSIYSSMKTTSQRFNEVIESPPKRTQLHILSNIK